MKHLKHQTRVHWKKLYVTFKVTCPVSCAKNTFSFPKQMNVNLAPYYYIVVVHIVYCDILRTDV